MRQTFKFNKVESNFEVLNVDIYLAGK